MKDCLYNLKLTPKDLRAWIWRNNTYAQCLFIAPKSTLLSTKLSVIRGAGPYRALDLWLDLMNEEELAAIP